MLNLIHNKLKTYNISDKQSELNAIKEISQEIALSGLSRAGFFEYALFQGGTCLRILHGLNRFSEDLDFILNQTDANFNWQPYLLAIQSEFASFDLKLEIQDRSKADAAVKKAFLKDKSFGKVLNLQFERTKSDIQTITIKLEIDTNPPIGSTSETHFLDYPYPFSIISQDLPSLFAGKCHALLCREYVKGRDWFDFIWYIQNKVTPNLIFLKNALEQTGPFKNTKVPTSPKWLVTQLKSKINSIDWQAAANDVMKFLPRSLLHSAKNWNAELFLNLAERLNN